MIHRKISTLLLIVMTVSSPTAEVRRLLAQPLRTQQDAKSEGGNSKFDPMKHLLSGFPGSVTIRENGHLLEFCPDNTCDGFTSSANVPVAELKDFAYLYIYFFSEYIYLPQWRDHAETKNAAKRVLAQPAYRNCKYEGDRQKARCVLLNLSRNGRIKLIFVRYDENRRNVVLEDIPKELSRKPASAE